MNTSANPQNSPTTDELEFINQQSTSKYKKNKLEALSTLYDSQKSEFTKIFINHFAKLFNPVLLPSDPLYVYGGFDDE